MRSLLALCAAAIALLGLPPHLVRAQTSLPVVRVGAAVDDQSTPLLYAIQAGLFTRAGIDVQLVKLSGGVAIAAAVVGHSLEIGKSDLLGVATAHAKGLPFLLIAPATFYRSEYADLQMVVLKKSPLRSCTELGGKIVSATSLGTLPVLGTSALVDQAGGDSKSIHWLEMPQSAMLAALEQGHIDAAPLYGPYLPAALNSGRVRVICNPSDGVAKRFEDSAWYASTDWIAQNRDTVQRFARVIHDANVYVAGHPAETLPLLSEYGGLDPALLANIHRSTQAPYIVPSAIQPVIDTAARYGVIPKPFPAQELISDLALRAP